MQRVLSLIEGFENKRATVGVVGVGYVGKSIGVAAAKEGYCVKGYDVSTDAVIKVNALGIPGFTAYNVPEILSSCDIVAICVPTPVKGDRSPDLGPLKSALDVVGRFLRKGQLVLVESSIAPGTTRNVVLRELQKQGLEVDEDFFLAYSPERVDPGNKKFDFANIPKVVAGIGEKSGVLAYAFYNNIVSSVHLVSSIETAEMTKLFENTFRLVNISLVNELSEYTKKLGVNIFEVIEAAATKPFGFLPHFPGPGVGGHCIPVDPYYLLHDAALRGVKLGIVHEAGNLNSLQPRRVVAEGLKIIKKTNGKKKSHKALVAGVSYKENVDDTRESASEVVMHLLEKNGVETDYFDPHVAEFSGKKSILLDESILKYDLIIVMVGHKKVDYRKLASYEVPILDTREVYRDLSFPHIFNFFVDGDVSVENIGLRDYSKI